MWLVAKLVVELVVQLVGSLVAQWKWGCVAAWKKLSRVAEGDLRGNCWMTIAQNIPTTIFTEIIAVPTS